MKTINGSISFKEIKILNCFTLYSRLNAPRVFYIHQTMVMISLIIHIRITLKLEKVFSFGHSDVFAMDYIPLKS